MNKKIILTLSLIVSAVLLVSLWVTVVQSFPISGGFRIVPSEWHQTSSSIILNEGWSWDWTTSMTPPGPEEGIIVYKRTGDTLFFTPGPPWAPGVGFPTLTAYRVGQSMMWGWKGGEMVMGGPDVAHLMMFNGTISITFAGEDIALTDDDNNYRGLRLLIEGWIDLYGLEDIGGGQYVWQGLVHQHIIVWAPKGSRA